MSGLDGGTTAQTLYRTWIRHQLGPQLRRLGFKGSSGRYVWPDEACWAFLSLQGSKWNTASEVVFTVNLKVVDRAAWKVAVEAHGSWYPARPDPSGHYGFHAERLDRLSSPLPGATFPDGWWRITGPEDLDPVLDDLVRAVIDRGLPWLHASMAELGRAAHSGRNEAEDIRRTSGGEISDSDHEEDASCGS